MDRQSLQKPRRRTQPAMKSKRGVEGEGMVKEQEEKYLSPEEKLLKLHRKAKEKGKKKQGRMGGMVESQTVCVS